MSEKQKQIEFERDYSIHIAPSATDGRHWYQIMDENDDVIREQEGTSETREDALTAAEHELTTMFNEWYDDYLTEKHKD